MSANSIKSWNRPWSVQEIADNASNWSLAGDAGLLKYLETFSENLLAKADETNNNLNKLLEGLNEASISLDIVKNEFSSLHNTQFIENRVYEDDETLPAEEESLENVEDKKPNEEEKMKVMKEAVMRGINVVEKYYEKVEVPASDTEDEADFPSFVLRPKDPYIDRPLPFVIGSEDWYKKWHVGLLDSSSDSEVDKISEKFSDSDSEDDLPIQDRTGFKGISNSGSEADISSKMRINKPVANSTFDESIKQPDMFGSSDSDDYNSVPVHAPISTRSFAQELAAKLGNVIEQNPQVIEPEINRKPIQNAPPPRAIGNIFSDEPPPLDEEEDALFGNSNAQQGLFSGGGGLFDDLDDDDNLWKDKNKKPITVKDEVPKSKLPNLFEDEDDEIFSTQNQGNIKAKNVPNAVPKKITEGLFDDDEDDLFQESITKIVPSKPYIQPVSKASIPYIADEPPELEPKESDTKAKKPIGGVKIFGGADLFAQQKVGDLLRNRRQDSTESSDNDNISVGKKSVESTIKVPEETVIQQETDAKSEKKPKQLSLFDDDDSALFEDDLFSNMSSKKFTSSLFDKDPLDDLFVTPTANTSSSIKEPTPETLTQEVSTDSTDASQPTPKVRETIAPVQKLKSASLFDDDTETENIFSTSTSVLSKSVAEDVKSAAAASQKQDSTRSTININFFDQNPPELDDDWDTKSENNLFEENDATLFDSTPEISSRRSGLFDNEPPSLFSESSGIVRDASARVETDDSFNPYASSSRRFSTDIFNEQQSSDSFFVTKNKSHSDYQSTHSNLDRIPEISNAQVNVSSQSNLEITPSGNVDDLFSDSTVSASGLEKSDGNKGKVVIPQNSSEDYDLFSDENFLSDKVGNKNVDLSIEKTKLFDDSDLLHEQKIEASSVESTEAKKEKDMSKPVITKTKPTVAKRPDKISPRDESVVDDDTKTDVEDAVAAKIGSPGKLKHNLNINVNALMPGVSLPKKKELGKSHSFEVASSHEDSVMQISVKSDSSLCDENKSTEKSVSFENPSDTPEVLPSITKDRVRIPVKRRPSTRKARHESIRNSVPDFKINIQVENVSKEVDEIQHTRKVKTIEQEVKTDFEDIFAASESDLFSSKTINVVQKDISKIDYTSVSSKKESSNIFLSDSPDSETDLFGKNLKINTGTGKSTKEQKIQKPESSNKSQNIFLSDSPDLETDLFGENLKISTDASKSTNEPGLDVSKSVDKSKNIFLSDSPDLEIDLFGQNQNPTINVEISKSTNEQKVQKDDGVAEEQLKPSIFGGERRSVINSDSFESADFNKSDLFEESEDFDDIFSSKKLPPKSNILKKSLFDDELDDDDDDIFGPPAPTTSRNSVAGGVKAPERKQPKTAQIKKLENSEAVEDPLSSFLDD